MGGKRTKPTALKIVTGNPGKRPLPKGEPAATGRPIKPKFLKGRASRIWKEYFDVLHWLTEADSHMFATWCGIAEEVEDRLALLDSARITQYRLLGSDLGLSPAARAKLGTQEKKKTKDPAEKYF